MEYELVTEQGHFFIRLEPLGLWDLWVNDMPTLTFSSAEEAAEAVYGQRSGYTVWDQLESHSAPKHLDGWVLHESTAEE